MSSTQKLVAKERKLKMMNILYLFFNERMKQSAKNWGLDDGGSVMR